MSTPIENNTEGLRDILQLVNNLPEAGGGGGSDNGIFATMVAPPSNQSIIPAITSYANNVDMEGDDV